LGAHDEDPNGGIRPGDFLVHGRFRISCGIEFQAKKFEIGASGGPHFRRIFSDARSKNQSTKSNRPAKLLTAPWEFLRLGVQARLA